MASPEAVSRKRTCLPDTVVMSESVNQFKNRLDKFWSNQDLIYNYKAELTGIGNRSSI